MIRIFLVGAGLLAPAAPVFAHSMIEGIGDFYNGLLHPFAVPTHALAVISLGLLLGQRGPAAVKQALPLFALSLALALLVSDRVGPLPLTTLLLGLGALHGLLLALAWRWPVPLLSLLAVAAAVGVGLDSNPDGFAGWDRLVPMSGIWLAASFAVLWFFGAADAARRHWQKVAVRVIGSWAAAIAIMVLALQLAR